MQKRFSIWDIIAWICLIFIVIWLILKVTGVINTPVLVEYAPYFTGVYIAGWAMHNLKSIGEDVKELKSFREQTIEKIHNIETNCVKRHFK